jgi:uncharacterized protein
MPFLINLKNEFKKENFIERDYLIPLEDLDLPQEYTAKEDIKVHVYIIKEKDGYALSMTFKSGIDLECGRCLTHYNMDLNGTSNIFLSKKKLHHGKLHGADLDIRYLEDEEHFNLNEVVREEIIIRTPMKPLCDENCKGICPICGSNKNENPCSCEIEERRKNSPFSVLGKLLQK